jgi:uncharacterized Fe-S cluster protein YjdI
MARNDAELRRAREVVRERSGGLCEVGIVGACTRRAVHVHHCIRGNPRVHDPEFMKDFVQTGEGMSA